MYTYPSATINFITYTARRWGQFPTITYVGGGIAGSEIVTLTDNPMSSPNITVQIQSTVSTNTQIVAAINAARGIAVDGLYANDMVSMAITGGHGSDTNTASGPTSLSGASSVPAPVPSQPFQPTGVTPGSYTDTDLTVDEFGRITAATNGAGGSGATPALDNLASVAINTSLLPGLDNTISLGNLTHSYVNLYAQLGMIFGGDSDIKFAYDSGDNVFILTGTGGGAGNLRGGDSLLFEADGSAPAAHFQLQSSGISTIRGNSLDFAQWSNPDVNETSMLLYDTDSGILQRVKVTANDAVAGVTGRVLYVADF